MKGRPGPSWSVVVKAPAEKVYEYVADVGRHPEWANGDDKLSVKPLAEGAPRVGGEYDTTGILMGRPNPAKVTITSLEPPRRVEFEAADKQGVTGHVITLEAADGGTRVTRQIYGVKQPFFGPLLLLLFRGAINKDYETALANLKSRLEAAPIS
jgi:uncharacterized protein YndB with AHSA1/START domain